MSRSVAYCVLIKNGEKRKFEDAWAHLKRELIWGPDVLEAWLEEGEQIDWEPEDVDSAALVDFDNKKLVWGERNGMQSAKAFSVYSRLLSQTWNGFTIECLRESQMYNLPADFYDGGRANRLVDEDEVDGLDNDELLDCIETVQEAAEYLKPDPDDEDDYDDDEEPFAWLTIVDKHGKARHRKLYELPIDLLCGDKSAMNTVAKQGSVEVPSEKSVSEGFCIDIAKKEIFIWGPPRTLDKFVKANQSWKGWSVNWAGSGGYGAQCEISGVRGVPMSDAEALSEFLPALLSNKRTTFANIVGAVGGSLKKTAIKATGCLTILLATPILLAGFFMSKLTEAGYAVIALVVIMVIMFKVLEWRIKSKFAKNDIAGHMASKDNGMEEQRSPVAGAVDEKVRLAEMNELLASCSLPSWETLEKQFPEMGKFPL